MTTEHKFGKSFITCTPGYENDPFEIVMGEQYYGNQQLSGLEAKQIADFIYESLGLNDKSILNVASMTPEQEKEVNDAWDNFQKIREKQLAKEDDLLIDILTGKRK